MTKIVDIFWHHVSPCSNCFPGSARKPTFKERIYVPKKIPKTYMPLDREEHKAPAPKLSEPHFSHLVAICIVAECELFMAWLYVHLKNRHDKQIHCRTDQNSKLGRRDAGKQKYGTLVILILSYKSFGKCKSCIAV